MEVSYGIGTTNRYALFYDENEDPMEALKKAQEPPSKDAKEKSKQVEAKPKGKPTAAPVKKDAKEATVPAKPAEQTRPKEEGQKTLGQRPPQARGDRGGRAPANGNREERNNRRNDDRPRDFSAPSSEGPGVVGAEQDYRGRGVGARGGSSRGGRVRGRGRPQDNRGKREYERQSGSDKSGVKSVEKREGAGSHNWGSVKDEIEGQLEVATEGTWAKEGEPTENTTAEGAENKEATEEGAADAEAAAAAEEEAKVLTLDEWKARRGERKKPEFNIRKPGEGEDDGQWKKTYLIEKKKGENSDDDEEEYGEYLQRAGRQKHLDIDIRFADSRRGGTGGMRGGSGGRGRGAGTRGGRGAPGRGAPRPTQPRGGSQQHAPKVDDENDFPALG